MPKIESAIISALEMAATTKQFAIVSHQNKKTKRSDEVDYDKLIAIEERKLERAKEAYLAEIDTIEQYKHNKTTIEKKIDEYRIFAAKQNVPAKINLETYAARVSDIIAILKSETASPQEKNEALRTVIDHIVYEKLQNNLAIYFHE